MSQASAAAPSYSADHVIAYDYKRSVGPVLGRFFTALRERRIVGNRTRAGRVMVPPTEADPDSGESMAEGFVDVGPTGRVTSWSWIPKPRQCHPLDRPFAWALVQLDGADTSLLHAVDAGDESAMSTGMRVRPRWRRDTRGEIGDIECFEAEG